MRLATVLSRAFALAFALGLASCSVEHHVTGPPPWQSAPPVAPAPLVADSPENAVRLFGEGWNRMDLGVFEGLLTTDFRFVFALGDSVGNAFRDHPIGRDELLVILGRIFNGGGSTPPATGIDLVLDATPRALPDSRPGMNPGWHKEVLTSVDLIVSLEGGAVYRVQGYASLFVVRGDSAHVATGVVADSTRWFLQQWNDETLAGGGFLTPWRAVPAGAQAPQGGRRPTWGSVLALYYTPPPPPPKGF